MNTENLKVKIDAFRTHPATKKVIEVGGSALQLVAVGITVKVVTFVIVAGTKALIEEINNQVNKTN